jgi:cytochrome c-type biogenesis protein CcmF
MILAGELALWVALLMAAWCAMVSFAGGRLARADLVASGERAAYATTALVIVASVGLWTAIFTHDFSLRYVASFTSSNLPKPYLFAAFWGGQAGSLLFWALLLAIMSAIAVYTNRSRNRELMPYVTGTLGVLLLFFLATLVFASNPFERLDFIPADGRGMNPQLQNPGMAIHPPNLYLGFVSTHIPFAFAIGALITRRLDTQWLAAVRRWALFSWLFLTVGIVLGMWWAYVELGWAGYWAWDPVENSSLLPWLTQTAFLHSVMIQEKRGMLRKWNVTLVAATFLLSILGTFITRSGVIESVHAFAQSEIGNWFLAFLLVGIATTAYLVTTRLSDLQAKAQLESMVSREAAFLYNNVALVAIAFSVLWGTLFPILSEAVKGEKITVGAPFFNTVNIPLGLLLLALTGIGPLIAWRRTSIANLKRQFAVPVASGAIAGVLLLALGMRDIYPLIAYTLGSFVAGTLVQEFARGTRARRTMYGEAAAPAFVRLIARNRRRYGGYIVHAGIVVMFAAFAGMAFRISYGDVELGPGETFEGKDPYGRTWSFTNQGLQQFKERNRHVTGIALAARMEGGPIRIVTSEKRQHVDAFDNPTFEPSTEVGLIEGARQDVYVVLAGVSGESDAVLAITFNPLVVWVWIGGALMAIGGLIVMWPAVDRRRVESGYVAVMRPEHAGAGS